jgi:LysM repeat protein
MNKPNPLVPQGTFPDKGKAQIRLTVFAILAVHLVALVVLLIAGCNKKTPTDQAQTDTGLPPVPPPPVEPWPTPPPAVPAAPVAQDIVQPTPTPSVPPPDTTLTPQPITPTPEPIAVPTLSEHTISKGESFYTLGKKYGVGYKAIADANPGVNPTRLKIGDKIKIPPPKSPGAAKLNGAFAPAGNGDGGAKTYKVKSGDNLMKIAKTYGVTVKQLRAENNLRTDQIKVGQTLRIPTQEPAPAPTLESIPPVPAAPPAIAPPPGITPPPQ